MTVVVFRFTDLPLFNGIKNLPQPLGFLWVDTSNEREFAFEMRAKIRQIGPILRCRPVAHAIGEDRFKVIEGLS